MSVTPVKTGARLVYSILDSALLICNHADRASLCAQSDSYHIIEPQTCDSHLLMGRRAEEACTCSLSSCKNKLELQNLLFFTQLRKKYFGFLSFYGGFSNPEPLTVTATAGTTTEMQILQTHTRACASVRAYTPPGTRDPHRLTDADGDALRKLSSYLFTLWDLLTAGDSKHV